MLELEKVIVVLVAKMEFAWGALEFARKMGNAQLAEYWIGRIDLAGELMRAIAELEEK